LAESDNAPFAAARDPARPILGVQFHPEVNHTRHGKQMIRNFLFGIARLSGDWVMSRFVDDAVAKIRAQVGGKRVICGLSGGVDSLVTAALIYRAIGERLTCIFVDT